MYGKVLRDPKAVHHTTFAGDVYTLATASITLTAGTLVAAGLTVDTDTLVVDSANNRVGVGTASPQSVLHLADQFNAIFLLTTDGYGHDSDSGGQILFQNHTGNLVINNQENGSIDFRTNDIQKMMLTPTAFNITSGDFTVDTDTLVVDATNNRVGIGINSPATALNIGNGGVLQVNSAGDDKNVQLYHDDTNGYLKSSSGKIYLDSASNIEFNSLWGIFMFHENGTLAAALYSSTTNDELKLGLSDATGNQFILTNSGNVNHDHDHEVQTNPTLYIHSDTDPDSENDEWISMTHDVTDGVIAVGSGNIRLEKAIKILEQAAADGDTAAYGQLWVKNTTPCELWFTDDAGTDTQIV